MKNLPIILLSAALLAGCSDNYDRRDTMLVPPVEAEPEPPEMMPSFANFARTVFAEGENNTPISINDKGFYIDAVDDDFSDLLQ